MVGESKEAIRRQESTPLSMPVLQGGASSAEVGVDLELQPAMEVLWTYHGGRL